MRFKPVIQFNIFYYYIINLVLIKKLYSQNLSPELPLLAEVPPGLFGYFVRLALVSYITTYSYYNGKTRTGTIDQRKDLGFEWVKITKQDGSYGYTYFNQTPDLAGMATRETQYDPTGQLVSDIQNTMSVMNPYPGTRLTLIPQKRMIAYEGGVAVYDATIDTLYDSYGFATQRTTHTVGFQPQIETQVFQHDVANNIFGRIVEKAIYVGSVGGTKLIHERSVYNGLGATCGQPGQLTLICEKQVWLDKDKNGAQNRFISTFFNYNIYGATAATTDALGRTTSFEYDAYYQTFVTLTTNPKGYRTASTYDFRFGKKLTTTDVENNVTAAMEYDVFGQHVKSRDTNGNVTKEIIYAHTGNANTQYTEQRITDESADGYQWSRAYFDGLGRTYKKLSEGYGASSANLQSDIVFDAVGRKASETNEYLNPGGTPQVTNYSYRADGRLGAVIFPEDREDQTGKVRTTYSYGTAIISGQAVGTTTVTDAKGNSKTTYKDARRQTIRVDDPLATVSHTYDEIGQLVETIDADGRVTQIEYDSLGRKIRMTEPNSGTLVYRYDDVGNLVEQVDGKGQAILFTYDILNRLTFKNLPGSETDIVYEYDSANSTFGIGRLSKVTDAAGVVEYNYDKRGNMSAWKRTIDNYAFSFEATYDIRNRQQQLTYPDGYKSRNYYSDLGHLRQVRMLSPTGFFGSALVTYEGPETTGTTELLRKLGNGVISRIGFDDATRRPVHLKTALKNDTAFATPVQDYEYAYDDVGNLTDITDNVNANRSETFTFDNLYRLTEATSAMYGTKNYAFTAGGNLTQNGTLQLYYGSDSHCTASAIRPVHGVCADSLGNQFAYDLNGNMIRREGRDLEYDAQDRLKSIKENGIAKLSFVYNHAGERIKKIRPDGAITYSIGGLYEVQKKPNGSEVHTKYFKGIKGDQIAQVTRDSSQVTLAQVTNTSTQIFLASGYGTFGAMLTGISSTIGYTMARHTSAGHVSFFLLIVIGGFGFIAIRSRGANSFALWRRIVATPSLVCFLTVVFIDCSGSSPGNNGTPWETTTGSTAGIPTLNQPTSTYNDTTLAGMPITGTFFLVPNHLGSTALVTDSSGTSVISELHYEPYGDVVESHSTGPDIIRNTYSGQIRDTESSLMYYGSRYYDTRLARFISADTVVPDAGDSQGYNRYMYVRGNPVDFVDPGGYGWFSKFISIVATVLNPIGAITTGAVGAVANAAIKNDWSLNTLIDGYAAANVAAAAIGVGALTGGVAFAAYGAKGFVATTAAGFFGGMAGGFVGGAGNAWIGGADFWDGIGAGLVGAAIGALTGFATSAAFYGLGRAWDAFKAWYKGPPSPGARAAAGAADDIAGAADDVANAGSSADDLAANGPVDGRSGWTDSQGNKNWINENGEHCIRKCISDSYIVSSEPMACPQTTICKPLDPNTIRIIIQPGGSFHNIQPSGPRLPTPNTGSGTRQVTGHPGGDDDRKSPAASS